MKTFIPLLLLALTARCAIGQITFEKIFSPAQIFYSESVIQENDSGFVVIGHIQKTNTYGYDACLFKTNKYGDSIWLKPTGFTEENHGYDAIKTNDNGYAFVGDINGGYGKEDMLLVKTDLQGNIEWNTNFGGVNWEHGYSLFQTNNNDFIMAGTSNSINDK